MVLLLWRVQKQYGKPKEWTGNKANWHCMKRFWTWFAQKTEKNFIIVIFSMECR